MHEVFQPPDRSGPAVGPSLFSGQDLDRRLIRGFSVLTVAAASGRFVVLATGPATGFFFPSLFLDENEEKKKEGDTSHTDDNHCFQQCLNSGLNDRMVELVSTEPSFIPLTT